MVALTFEKFHHAGGEKQAPVDKKFLKSQLYSDFT